MNDEPCPNCGYTKPPTASKPYVTFTDTGVTVDLKRYLSTPEGQAAVRDACKPEPNCWCHTCRPITLTDMRFVVCPDCGNKRCPKANHHDHACTNSNATGQPGSYY